MRLAELMDLPAVCLVGEAEVEPEAVASAPQHGTSLLVSPEGMFETCGRIHECLRRERRA